MKKILNWKHADSGALVIIYEEDDEIHVRHFPLNFCRAIQGQELKPLDLLEYGDEDIDLFIITHKLGG